MMTTRNLDRLMAPRSVALIGASGRPGSLGTVVLRRLLGAGFAGPIHLVNPRRREIDGRPCHPSVAEVPGPVDLGVVVTPAAAVPDVVAELGAAGARAAVVITAGVERRRMLDAARPHTLRILGPNCLGLIVPGVGLDASFAHIAARRGSLALLSQSGAIVTAMLDWAEARGLGFTVAASLGDMADVDVGDLLDHLAADAGTRAILLYLEQVTDARKFMSAARSAARVKPVIAVKAGRSPAAARAAASHTGALAGSDAVYDAALRRAGVLRVEGLEDLFDAAEALGRLRPVASDRLAVLTNGGGAGVLAADAVAASQGRLADLSAETMAALDAALPPTWSRGNPVDIIGDADAARYGAALEVLLADPDADAVLVMNCPTGLASSAEAAEAVIRVEAAEDVRGRAAKPILAAWLGGATAAPAAASLERAGIPTYRSPAAAVRGFIVLAEHQKAQTALLRTPPALAEDAPPDTDAARSVIARALAQGRPLLSEPEAKAVLAAYDIPTVPTRVAATPAEAEGLAEQILAEAEAMVVKILSPDLSHKSDVGGVRLNLGTPAEVRAAAEAVIAQARARRPEARIEGVVVQPMIRRPVAHELILGLADDPTFGPVILFGAGGTAVEVVADKAVALPPLDLVLAHDLIGRTRVSRLLGGLRDHPAADLDAVAMALVRLAQLAADLPEIRELDVNPLLADAAGVVALDTRIVVAPAPKTSPGDNPRFALRPYPSSWDREETVGPVRLRIRPIRPSDEALYPAFLGATSADDLRLRFFGGFGHVDHGTIARFTQIDYARAMAFVAIEPEADLLVGVSRLTTDPDGVEAEYAILVRSDWIGRGVGWALMRRLIDYARSEGLRRLRGDVLRRNERMLRMCRELGFAVEGHPEDGALMRVTLELRRADRA
jgi:acetyltransferase